MSSHCRLYNRGCADLGSESHSVSPIVCPATDGTVGDRVNEDEQNGNISDEEFNDDPEDHYYTNPHQPGVPQEPSVDEYLKHQITRYPFKPW